jgi:hypothetical protein
VPSVVVVSSIVVGSVVEVVGAVVVGSVVEVEKVDCIHKSMFHFRPCQIKVFYA